jgi:arylsulfatase A-like enzyme
LAMMPETRARIGSRGISYVHAVANTPLCCPARATIMTGLYAHNHGVIDNRSAGKLDQSKTVQARLRSDGYHTALFGKFFNHFFADPPKFDYWFSFGHPPKYEDSEWNVNGNYKTIQGYSTDLIRERAVSHLEKLESNDDKPWLFLVTPLAPHVPSIPAPRHRDNHVSRWRPNAGFRERDESDKPRYVRLATASLDEVREGRAKELRSLIAVDGLVEKLDKTLDRLEERRNTIVFFASDNGYSWGEHGLFGPGKSKNHPYRTSVEVPLMMRWPREVEARGRSGRRVGLVDVAPTIFDAVNLSGVEVDGRSLLKGGWKRPASYLEHWLTSDTPDFPTWRELRSRRYNYTEYYRDGKVIFREYYALSSDPWETHNLLHDGVRSNNPPVGDLHRRLRRLKDCKGTSGPDSCP